MHFKQQRSGTIAALSDHNVDNDSINIESHNNDSTIVQDGHTQFMYLNMIISNKRITALLDSGSAINIISKSLFDVISASDLINFQSSNTKITLANDQNVSIYGTASIKVQNHVSGQSNLVFISIRQFYSAYRYV